jgi:hypothetical protein
VRLTSAVYWTARFGIREEAVVEIMKGKKKSEELAAEVYTEDTEEGNSVPLYAYQLKASSAGRLRSTQHSESSNSIHIQHNRRHHGGADVRTLFAIPPQ